MCDNLQKSRAKYVSYATSKNPDALYTLADRIDQVKLGYCEDHREKAEQLAKFCRESAAKMVAKFFAD